MDITPDHLELSLMWTDQGMEYRNGCPSQLQPSLSKLVKPSGSTGTITVELLDTVHILVPFLCKVYWSILPSLLRMWKKRQEGKQWDGLALIFWCALQLPHPPTAYIMS